MQVSVTARTTLSPEQVRHAVERIDALEPLAPGPVLGARVRVGCDDNRRLPHAFHAEGEIDVNGRLVRAHVTGPSADAAVDRLAERLERQLRGAVDRRTARRRRNGRPEPGQWRHGDLPTRRRAFFPRPAEDREVVRRKTFALEPMTPVEAAADMVDLDHDFYLFHDARTGADAVIHRLRDDGRLGLVETGPAAPQADARWLVTEPNRLSDPVVLETAITEMNALGHRFLFFVDRDTRRGRLLYVRYDGHYGLIEARD